MPFNAGAIVGSAKLDTTSWRMGIRSMAKVATVGMLAITAAVTVAMTKSIKKANEWQKAMTNVNTIVDESVVNTQEMAKALIKLDPALGNTTELTKGMYQAFSAGAETMEEAMAITVESAKFARAGLTDTFTAVDVITTAVNAYGKETMSAERASNLLFNTIKRGKVTGEQLAGALGASIPLFASVGIEMEELTAGLASMTKVGINANRSTTQLNAIVNAFIKPSQMMQQALEEQGYASGSAFLEAEGLSGALDLLQEKTQGNANILGKYVRNVRGMRGVMALARGGAEEFNKVLAEQGTLVDTTQNAFEEQEKTFDTLKNSMDKVQLVIGNIGKHFVDKIAVGAITASKGMLDFIMSARGMDLVAEIASKAAGGFELIKTVFSTLMDEVLPPLIDFWDDLVVSFGSFNTEADAGMTAAGLLAGALNLVGAGFAISSKFAKINIDLLRDMIQIAIETGRTVGNLFQLLARKKTLEEVQAQFNATGQAIKNLGINFVDNVEGLVEETVNQFKNFGQDTKDIQLGIVTDVRSASDDARNYIYDNWDRIITGQTDFLGEYLENLRNSNDDAEGDTSETTSNMEATWKDYFSNINTGMQSVANGFSEVWNMAMDNQIAMLEATTAEELALLQTRSQQGIISEEELAAATEQLEADKNVKLNELKKKSFETNKKFQIADTLMTAASAVMGWWNAATKLGPIAGPIFAGIMSAATGALAIAKTAIIKKQQFIPSRERGGMSSGMTRINESGGELVVLPDRSIVVPNDISRQIARGPNQTQNVMNVNFAGANISNNMDLRKVTDYVSRELAREMRAS